MIRIFWILLAFYATQCSGRYGSNGRIKGTTLSANHQDRAQRTNFKPVDGLPYTLKKDSNQRSKRRLKGDKRTEPPSRTPSVSPTFNPTQSPSNTHLPSDEPSWLPSVTPTASPTSTTASPTMIPTDEPTQDPTMEPTTSPTELQTMAPSSNSYPSSFPSISEESFIFKSPTIYPTVSTTMDPTNASSPARTLVPTQTPSMPTQAPSQPTQTSSLFDTPPSPLSNDSDFIHCSIDSQDAIVASNVEVKFTYLIWLDKNNAFLSNVLPEVDEKMAQVVAEHICSNNGGGNRGKSMNDNHRQLGSTGISAVSHLQPDRLLGKCHDDNNDGSNDPCYIVSGSITLQVLGYADVGQTVCSVYQILNDSKVSSTLSLDILGLVDIQGGEWPIECGKDRRGHDPNGLRGGGGGGGTSNDGKFDLFDTPRSRRIWISIFALLAFVACGLCILCLLCASFHEGCCLGRCRKKERRNIRPAIQTVPTMSTAPADEERRDSGSSGSDEMDVGNDAYDDTNDQYLYATDRATDMSDDQMEHSPHSSPTTQLLSWKNPDGSAIQSRSLDFGPLSPYNNKKESKKRRKKRASVESYKSCVGSPPPMDPIREDDSGSQAVHHSTVDDETRETDLLQESPPPMDPIRENGSGSQAVHHSTVEDRTREADLLKTPNKSSEEVLDYLMEHPISPQPTSSFYEAQEAHQLSNTGMDPVTLLDKHCLTPTWAPSNHKTRGDGMPEQDITFEMSDDELSYGEI